MPLKGRAKVDKAIEETYLQANDDVRGVYLQGLYNIVIATPVDEGRARNNWFLTTGAPSSKSTTSKSKGLGAIRQLRQMPKRVVNQKMFFTNNLPYIETLEYGGYPNPVKKGTWVKKSKSYEVRSTGGYSKQVAPDGWVRKTLKAMAKKIRQL